MMLAGVPVADSAAAELAWIVQAAGGDVLADRRLLGLPEVSASQDSRKNTVTT